MGAPGQLCGHSNCSRMCNKGLLPARHARQADIQNKDIGAVTGLGNPSSLQNACCMQQVCMQCVSGGGNLCACTSIQLQHCAKKTAAVSNQSYCAKTLPLHSILSLKAHPCPTEGPRLGGREQAWPVKTIPAQQTPAPSPCSHNVSTRATAKRTHPATPLCASQPCHPCWYAADTQGMPDPTTK